MRRWRRGSSEDSKQQQKTTFQVRPDDSLDEILEIAWLLDEEGDPRVEELLLRAGDNAEDLLQTATEAGWIAVAANEFAMMPTGRERAREIIRRHRLAETLLTEILELDNQTAETDACRFEHILSPEATESICTLLGHPPTCPHGKPIPRGSCCKKFKKELSPLVTPLNELSPGEVARIVFITPKSHARLDRLASLGIVPGSDIRLHQKQPTCVLKIGQTDVAIDSTVAGEIFVKRV